MSTINQQTPGPAWVDDDNCVATGGGDDYRTIAEVFRPNRRDLISIKNANARLLAAAYTAFDKAGRDLGVDAAELAHRIDLAGLIHFVRIAASYPNEHQSTARVLISGLPGHLAHPEPEAD